MRAARRFPVDVPIRSGRLNEGCVTFSYCGRCQARNENKLLASAKYAMHWVVRSPASIFGVAFPPKGLLCAGARATVFFRAVRLLHDAVTAFFPCLECVRTLRYTCGCMWNAEVHVNAAVCCAKKMQGKSSCRRRRVTNNKTALDSIRYVYGRRGSIRST